MEQETYSKRSDRNVLEEGYEKFETNFIKMSLILT